MRTRQTREEQVERNRALVLAAARRVFLARGYAGATVDAIAEDAGFSKGVVYSQFDSKADMFLSLLEARINERSERHDQLASELQGRQLARAVLEMTDDLMRAEPQWSLLVLEFRAHAARIPELNTRYALLHERTVDRLAAMFDRLHEQAGTAPQFPVRVMAELVLALDSGVVLERVANPAALPRQQFASFAVQVIAGPAAPAAPAPGAPAPG